MKKLLLTSTGLSNKEIASAFLNLVTKPPQNIKVAFVPTAATSHDEMEYVAKSRDELINLGIKKESIKEINLDHDVAYSEIKDCDVLYVCGGNTFYLLDKIKRSNFNIAIEKFLREGKVYLGVSAGSIVVTPSIAIANVEPADPNEASLTNFKGLSLVDFEVSPHVPEIVSYNDVDKYSQATGNKVYAIDHNSAVIVQDKVINIIGDGESRVYN